MKKLLIALLALVLAIGLFLPAATPAAADSLRPLVGMWRFNGNAGDASGYSNNGTLKNFGPTPPPYWVAGKFSQALNFDGVNDYVQVPDNPSLDITNNLTIEAWVKLDSFSSTRSYIVSKDSGSPGGRSYALFVEGGFGTPGRVGLRVFKAGGSSTHLGNTILNPGDWYHVAATYQYIADGSSVMNIFVNGVRDSDPMTTAVGPIYSGTSPLYVGASPLAAPVGFFDGLIDEVRIWSTPHPIYTVSVTPGSDANPVGTSHTITATVRANYATDTSYRFSVPGVPVNFLFSDNSTNQANTTITTDSTGQATLGYVDASPHGGMDQIAVWVDQDSSGGDFDLNLDAWAIARKSWVENFATGGGNIKDGNKVIWTFSGTVGVLPGGGIVGSYEIVNHVTGISYYSDNFSSLNFSGNNATSPSATHNVASFVGLFIDDAGQQVRLSVNLRDLGEPGAGVDTIRVIDIGLSPQPPAWPPPPPTGNYWIGNPTTGAGTPISGGNFQVHDAASVVPPLPPLNAFQKGVSFNDWRPFNSQSTGLYTSPGTDVSLSDLASTGANWIFVTVIVGQDNITSTEIFRNSPATATDAELKYVIDLAHSKGVRVAMRTGVRLSNDPTHWWGEIGTTFTTETQWENWFTSYRAMVNHYATFAQNSGVDMLVVGDELRGTSSREQDWRQVVQEVRQRYSGPITYASVPSNGETQLITWWDALDYIGLDFYLR